MYKKGIIGAENRVAQQENLALWLAKDGEAPWLWVIPTGVKVTTEKHITFLECDRTWVAVRPLGITDFRMHDSLRITPEANMDKDHGRFPGHRTLTAKGTGTAFSGMAIEIGEKESHGSFSRFKKAVRSSEVDVSELEKGVVRYKASDGKWLGIHWNDDPLDLGVWRSGKRRDLKEAFLYNGSVISAPWGAGVLEVNAGGERFRCEVDASGNVR